MLPNCHSIRCKIMFAAWQFIVCAHKFPLAERNFEEKSPFAQVNCRSIRHEISCELSSKNHGNKERNLRISLALLLHNTVGLNFAGLLYVEMKNSKDECNESWKVYTECNESKKVRCVLMLAEN